MLLERETDIHKVQERALNAVPDLCETVDYAEVAGTLFPRVAVSHVLSRLTLLSLTTLFAEGLHRDTDTVCQNRDPQHVSNDGQDARSSALNLAQPLSRANNLTGQSYTKARTSSIENSHKRAGCYGECHCCLGAWVQLTVSADGDFVSPRSHGL